MNAINVPEILTERNPAIVANTGLLDLCCNTSEMVATASTPAYTGIDFEVSIASIVSFVSPNMIGNVPFSPLRKSLSAVALNFEKSTWINTSGKLRQARKTEFIKYSIICRDFLQTHLG
jgi:hypothetical protein